MALASAFHRALWVLGAIALPARAAIFTLVRSDARSDPVAKTAIREAQTAVASTN
jgi:hypothetical protein